MRRFDIDYKMNTATKTAENKLIKTQIIMNQQLAIVLNVHFIVLHIYI